MITAEGDSFQPWKLGTFYVLDILCLIFFLICYENKFYQGFVDNFKTHLLGKQSGLKVRKEKSYSHNTETIIIYSPPVIYKLGREWECSRKTKD